jgi:macrodomain Ter protein organizer (MatP/YcbG family)
MGIPKKPVNVEVDKLIEGAGEAKVSSASPQKVKKFLLELPYDLWKELRIEAMQRDMTLKDYLLEIIQNRKV